MKNITLQDFIKNKCGGVTCVAQAVNITNRAIYKWIDKGSLPRTEFSGETNYSHHLAELSGFTENQIKEMFKP